MCTPCPIGTFGNGTGAVSATVCKHCPAGSYFPHGVEADNVRDPDMMCVKCPRGNQ